jgi:hypothetical protein
LLSTRRERERRHADHPDQISHEARPWGEFSAVHKFVFKASRMTTLMPATTARSIPDSPNAFFNISSRLLTVGDRQADAA